MMERKSDFVRNFIFGVEDSLVSTAGLVSGIAVAGVGTREVILSGIVLIFVEAFSMGVGALLSDNSADEYRARRELPLSRSLAGSAVMFLSYFLAGSVVLLPYLLLDRETAFWSSIAISLGALFVLGAISARLSGTSLGKKGATMLLVGGAAIALGIVVGQGVLYAPGL
jgi:VIT1/CCC1 family predicted Fe2+/Mn2+ transporter